MNKSERPRPLTLPGETKQEPRKRGKDSALCTAFRRWRRDAPVRSGRVSDGTRTRDHLDHNQELYLLSYAHHAGAQSAPPRNLAAGAQGTKTPCTANTPFGSVEPSPSDPPSATVTWPSCHTARLPSATMPGVTASALVDESAGRSDPGVAGHGARHHELERQVAERRALVQRRAAQAVGEPQRRARLELAAVVRQVGLAAHVRDAHRQPHVRLVGLCRRVPGHHPHPQRADRVGRLPVRVRSADRQLGGSLHRRRAGPEGERRAVHAVGRQHTRCRRAPGARAAELAPAGRTWPPAITLTLSSVLARFSRPPVATMPASAGFGSTPWSRASFTWAGLAPGTLRPRQRRGPGHVRRGHRGALQVRVLVARVRRHARSARRRRRCTRRRRVCEPSDTKR